MFDFFKDVYHEMIGLDLEKVKIEEAKKRKKSFVGGWSKFIIWFMGMVYLLIGGFGVFMSIQNNSYFSLIKYILLIVLDIVILVLISFRRKKCQQIGVVLIVVFIILNMTTAII